MPNGSPSSVNGLASAIAGYRHPSTCRRRSSTRAEHRSRATACYWHSPMVRTVIYPSLGSTPLRKQANGSKDGCSTRNACGQTDGSRRQAGQATGRLGADGINPAREPLRVAWGGSRGTSSRVKGGRRPCPSSPLRGAVLAGRPRVMRDRRRHESGRKGDVARGALPGRRRARKAVTHERHAPGRTTPTPRPAGTCPPASLPLTPGDDTAVQGQSQPLLTTDGMQITVGEDRTPPPPIRRPCQGTGSRPQDTAKPTDRGEGIAVPTIPERPASTHMEERCAGVVRRYGARRPLSAVPLVGRVMDRLRHYASLRSSQRGSRGRKPGLWLRRHHIPGGRP